jgi:hypothetical protein
MNSYHPLTNAPSPDWFESLPLPEGRTYVCLGRQAIDLDDVTRTNAQGQITNIARSKGTDKELAQELAGSMKTKGVLIDAQPPFITNTNLLLDGYTRFEAIASLGIESWVFNVVEPKEGFTEQNVWDEIGLGANDHPPSKRATRQDFSVRLKAHLQTMDISEVTEGYCIDWINRIPHSFSQVVVSNIASKCLSAVRSAETVETLSPADVVRLSKKQIEGEIVPIKQFSKGKDPVLVGYVNNTGSDELESIRNNAKQQVDRINSDFEALFQRRLKEGEKFKLVSLDYHAPQVVGVETSLVKVV